MTIMAAALSYALVLRNEWFLVSFSVNETFGYGQTVDICSKSDCFAWFVGIKNGIESCTTRHVVYFEAADLGKLFFQILDCLHLMATHLGIEMKVAAHLASIPVVILNLTKYLLVANFLSGRNRHDINK